jgi:hypothetical protein
MKLFNLDEVKAGKPIVTRAGLPARIICFDAKSNQQIVALILHENNKEENICVDTNGKYYYTDTQSTYDLFMKSEIKTGWINIYKDNVVGHFATEKEANANAHFDRLKCQQIEWEE